MGLFDIQRVFLTLPGIIIGLTVHEFCHAYMAHRCGDDTARNQGRVTLNPIKHIDPMGFFLLIIAGFGWAKPVMFTEENLRNPKTDVIKIALAGPFSNAILAILLSVIYAFLNTYTSITTDPTYQYLNEVVLYAIMINWGLFVFNLIPIPPLDGSHLLTHPLRNHPALYNGLYRYGTMALFGILIAESVLKITILPLSPLIQFLFQGFLSLVGV